MPHNVATYSTNLVITQAIKLFSGIIKINMFISFNHLSTRMSKTYYVYSLKDPRQQPASIFYIGKGTGSRATDHLKKIDDTRKGKLIREILKDGHTPIISKFIEKLSEDQAFQIELELISSFGTIDSGGSLFNTVIPKTIKRKVDSNIIIPLGALEKAQLGLKLLKDSITLLSEENPNEGSQQDYLTYSILGLLLKEGTLESNKLGNRRIYKSYRS